MDKVDAGDKEKRDPDKDQIVIIDDPPRIPGQHEETEPDDDAEQSPIMWNRVKLYRLMTYNPTREMMPTATSPDRNKSR